MAAITVANLKGGVGKTTSAVLLALGLADDASTLLISADPQQSALKWAHLAEDSWPWSRLNVVAWTDHRTLARQIESARDEYAHIVIDTPPSRDQVKRNSIEARTLESALTATGHLVVPTSSSNIDLTEIGDTFSVATSVDQRRAVYASVLLVRVRFGTRSALVAPELLANEFGYPVMQTVIPMREPIAQAFGTVPELTGPFSSYSDALTEIRSTHNQ